MTETKIFLFDMKPELQRIKIADACGWKWERLWTGELHGKPVGEQGPFREVPDYLNDLNAMHEAEKSIGDKYLYRKFLYLVVLDDPENIANEPAWATAAQRAEAFLRTLNLWEE